MTFKPTKLKNAVTITVRYAEQLEVLRRGVKTVIDRQKAAHGTALGAGDSATAARFTAMAEFHEEQTLPLIEDQQTLPLTTTPLEAAASVIHDLHPAKKTSKKAAQKKKPPKARKPRSPSRSASDFGHPGGL